MAEDFQTTFDRVSSAPPAQAVTPNVQLLHLIYGFAASQAVYVAAKIGLADELSQGPRSSAEIAAALGEDPERTHRLLRGLAHYGVLAQGEDERFQLTPVGALLQTGVPGSQRGQAVFCGEEHYPAWGGLLHAYQTGDIAFDHVFGMPFYAHLNADPDRIEGLQSFMLEQARGTARSLVDNYDYSAARTLVDIGGGYGTILAEILLANPQLHGVLFDRVTQGLDLYFDVAGLGDRTQVITGDFFQGVPTGGDIYLLSAILHNWNDTEAIRILRTLRQAMAPGGKLLIVELVVPERVSGPSPGVELDLLMWVLFNGYERTEAQFRTILEAAGFRLNRIISTKTPRPIVEAVIGDDR